MKEENRQHGIDMIESSAFDKDYIELRCILDALQIWALNYCLKDKELKVREERKREITSHLMPLIKKWGGGPSAASSPGECPDGYNNCGGVCVPYGCPESSST